MATPAAETGLAVIATALYCAYLALFPALVGSLQARSGAGPAVRLLLLIPALWMLAEWLRGWVLTGFPWLVAGYSQIDTPLAGFAPLAGLYGVSFALVLLAGLIEHLLRLLLGRAHLVALAGILRTLAGIVERVVQLAHVGGRELNQLEVPLGQTQQIVGPAIVAGPRILD